MNLLNISVELGLTFLFSLVFLFCARKVAKKIGLVDKPNYRKRHQGAVPLVGGISVFAGITFGLLFTRYSEPNLLLYLFCAGILVLVGAIDDRFDISVKIRAVVQALIAILMMGGAGLYLQSLGFILGPIELRVGPFGYVLTLFAVWAAINAFNMVDGIDGLLGGLSSVSFGALGVVLALQGQPWMAFWCFAMIAATLPYILLNLGLLGRRYKVFMGDAGSTLIGFTIIWVILASSQQDYHPLRPVTALWIIAIPLMDMVAIMYRRLRKGQSPFTADRQHIHHIVMRAGFSSRQAFLIITFAALVLAGIGITGEFFSVIPEWVMMLLFLFAFGVYGYCLKHAWRVARFVGRKKRKWQNRHRVITSD